MTTNMSDHDEPIKEIPVKKSKPVYITEEVLAEKLTGVVTFMEEIAKNAESNNKRAEAELQTITNIAQRMDNIEQTTLKIVNVLQEQPPTTTAAHQQQNKLTAADLINFIKEGAVAFKEVKSTMSGETTELDKWGGVAGKIALNEAVAGLKLYARRGVRKGLTSPEEIGEITGESVQKALGMSGGSSHEPVL